MTPLHDTYTQLMLLGILQIIFGLALIALAGWFLWKRFGKKKPPEQIARQDDHTDVDNQP